MMAIATIKLKLTMMEERLIVDKPKPRPTSDANPESPAEELREAEKHEATWYEILNVAPDASTAEIKRAYRMLVSQYHPDKVATLGDELKAVAERKSTEINGAYAEAIGRVLYEAASDDESLAAVKECCECEGILPAIESAHALAGAKRWAALHPGARMVICLSGRGDKDMPTLLKTLLAHLDTDPK